MHEIRYGLAGQVQNAITAPTTLTVTEADLYVVTDAKFVMYSQFAVMAQVTLGGVVSATFYYYVSPDGGTTWYPISLYNASTGEMTRRAVLLDSGTYSTGGVSYFNDDIAVSATSAFKVTGKAASGTPSYTVWVGGRNN
jgi:hypothetical protein